MNIVPGNLGDPRVVALLETHLTRSRAETAAGSAHALDLTGLKSPDVSFWTVWDEEVLLGFGALKRLSTDHGEVKSMHAFESERRKGIGSAMLRHIITAARARAMLRLSLETGSWDYFRPARGALSQARRRRMRAVWRLRARSEQRFHDARSADGLSPRSPLAIRNRPVAKMPAFLNAPTSLIPDLLNPM